MKLQYNVPDISITVDCVIFGFDTSKLQILLIKRASDPEKGKWALPGGFMEKHETAEESAERVLSQLTGVTDVYMDQLKVFAAVDRHPIERVITVPFYALVKPENYRLNPSSYASDAYWCDIDRLPILAFDHDEIINAALDALKRDVRLKPIGFELLPEKFTMKDLQDFFEAVLEEKLDRRNFRRKIKGAKILVKLNEVRKGAHKDAILYKFDSKTYRTISKNTFYILF
ncbi:MAG: NUDIX hydrolase [Cytophagaceae bacterium]|nr:NUDIX hydrolase [Cytophagaceae bacterium]